MNAPQASRSDRKHCLRHSEVIARLLKKKTPIAQAIGVFYITKFSNWEALEKIEGTAMGHLHIGTLRTSKFSS